MAKTVSYCYTDTAIDGVTTHLLELGLPNFGVDWTVVRDTPGEAVISNLTSPQGLEERFRFAMTPIKDVYRNSGITLPAYAPDTKGFSILGSLVSPLRVTDTADATYQVDKPCVVNITVKSAVDALITPDIIKAQIARAVNAFFNTGVLTTERLNALMRGSMLPADMR